MSRSRKSSSGSFGGFLWAIMILGLVVAFFAIPSDPGAKGIIDQVVSKSKTVQTWAEGVGPGVAEFLEGIIYGGRDLSENLPQIGGDPGVPGSGGGGTAGGGSSDDAKQGVESTTILLNTLKIADASNAAYNRDDYKHWKNVRSCWTVREEVLATEAVPGSLQLVNKDGQPVTEINQACEIKGGTWVDPYSGKTFTNPSDLDIDHIIPLSYVNSHGGSFWDANKKQAYANDLTNPATLIAVSKGDNRAKGDKGPSKWVPSNTAYHCQYATDWVNTATQWSISITQKDADKLREMLATC